MRERMELTFQVAIRTGTPYAARIEWCP